MPGWDKQFSSFKDRLHQAMEAGLPGADAQYKLVPPGRERPNIEQIKHMRSPRLAGVLALFYPVDNVPHVVLMKRNTYPGVHSGQISFPGGQKEDYDDDLVATALREAEEEVGAKTDQIEVLGSLTEVYIPPSNFLVQPVVGIQNSRPVFTPDATEVHTILEVPFHLFLDKSNLKPSRVSARDYTLEVPAYHVKNEVVWGATAMMISELTHLF